MSFKVAFIGAGSRANQVIYPAFNALAEQNLLEFASDRKALYRFRRSEISVCPINDKNNDNINQRGDLYEDNIGKRFSRTSEMVLC